MNSRLRHIALTVEPSFKGGYLWLLIESVDQRMFVLDRAKVASTTYLRALTAGFEHLALLSASGLHDRPSDVVPEGAEVFPRRQVELVD